MPDQSVFTAYGFAFPLLECTTAFPTSDLDSPASITRWLLVAMGYLSNPDTYDQTNKLAWPGFYDNEPPKPEHAVTCYDTAPSNDGRSMVTGESMNHYGVLIRIRSALSATGWAKARELETALAQQVVNRVLSVGSNRYFIAAYSGLNTLRLGKQPDSTRHLHTINTLVSLRKL